jgi:hypothetical protein
MLTSIPNIDATGFQKSFSSLLGSIPSNLHLPHESYYHSILLMALGSVGQSYESEGSSGDGFFDIHLQTSDGTDFIIELKYVSGKDKKTKANITKAQLTENMKKAVGIAMDQI